MTRGYLEKLIPHNSSILSGESCLGVFFSAPDTERKAGGDSQQLGFLLRGKGHKIQS
jgi:hypothetical protein